MNKTIRTSRGNESLFADLAELAKEDNRSLNNYIISVLLNHVQNETEAQESQHRTLEAEKIRNRFC